MPQVDPKPTKTPGTYAGLPLTPPKGGSGVSRAGSTVPGANPLPTKLNEKSRRYSFPGNWITLHDVTELFVSESGNHRLKTADGKLHIISPGWNHIEIVPGENQEWTL